MNIVLKTDRELALMREAAVILKSVQARLKQEIPKGLSLLELDHIAESVIRDAGAEPSFKGYQGFPATLCTMINSEVVHGIPDDRIPQSGDLLCIDCGVLWKGFHADAAFSVIVGGDKTNPERATFSRVVREALQKGCQAAKIGNHIGDIGAAIEKHIVSHGYSICKEYTGHGLGRALHEDPHVYNYGIPGKGQRLLRGMVLAIEPIVTMGNPQVKTLTDNWTVVTVDGQDACQWEHCGVVTESSLEIFV